MASWLTVNSLNNSGSRIRVLHVSKEYSSYEDIDLSVVLDNVHKKMVHKFKAISQGAGRAGAGSAKEAMELSNFFRDLKALDKYGDKANLITGIQKDILSSILSTAKGLLGKSNRSMIFTKGLKWQELEQAVGALSTATVAKAGNIEATADLFKSTQVGSSVFTAGTFDTLSTQIAQNLVEVRSAQVTAAWRKQAAYSKNNFVNISIENRKIAGGVVDVNGKALSEVTISAKANDKLVRIAKLLQRASFSVKNYSESFYSYRLKQMMTMQEHEIALKLGKSNIDTTFQALFQNELPPAVILSLFFYTQYTHKAEIRFAVSHLRFIYELTGYGQRYVDDVIEKTFAADFDGDSLFRANYLIWNNPASNTIVVKSTAELIMWAYEHYYAELDQSIYLPVNGTMI